MSTRRPTKLPKDKVIRARCDAPTEIIIHRAANALNLDLSDFIRIAATRYATQVTAQASAHASSFIPFA